MKISKTTLNPERVSKAWVIAHALAHPLRLRIINYIHSQRTTNVNSIYRTLEIEQSITSQHLRIMRVAGILEARREGKYVYYSIDYPTVIKAEKAIDNFVKAEKETNIEK